MAVRCRLPTGPAEELFLEKARSDVVDHLLPPRGGIDGPQLALISPQLPSLAFPTMQTTTQTDFLFLLLKG